MANYTCATRTNYFHVKDADAFRELMSRVYCSEDNVSLWEEPKNNEMLFAFGCYGSICGLRNADADEYDDGDEDTYDAFVEELQKCIADGDAVLIYLAGHEKLRYVTGTVTIITSTDYRVVDMDAAGTAMAKEMLGNPGFQTRTSY